MKSPFHSGRVMAGILALTCGLSSARADISTDNLPPAQTPPASAPVIPPATQPAPTAPPAEVPELAPAPAAGAIGNTTAATADPAKIAGFERRFAQGKAVEAQGKLQEARTIFDGILADAPDAKGSLREAGLISVELGEYAKADGYFSRLHALVPEYPMAIEALIQVNQQLKHEAKVEILIKQFTALFQTGKVPKSYFVRERIYLNGGTEIDITQFFDYHQPRYYAWVGELFDRTHTLKRRVTVNYDPDVTASMRGKDPRMAHAEQFLVIDNVLAHGEVARLDVYQQFLALPDYLKMRAVMLTVFANGLKPIDSAPVPAAPAGT